jgi:hypothetical protein
MFVRVMQICVFYKNFVIKKGTKILTTKESFSYNISILKAGSEPDSDI